MPRWPSILISKRREVETICLYIVYIDLQCMKCTVRSLVLLIVRCTVCSLQCAVCRVQFAVCSLQCEVCSIKCAGCSVQCIVCSVQYGV